MRTEQSPIEQAQLLARKHRLKVVGQRSASGGVREWRVFREMPGRLVFVGSSVSEAGALAIVKRAAASA